MQTLHLVQLRPRIRLKAGSEVFARKHGMRTHRKFYRSKLRRELKDPDSLESKCSCPVGYNCKHGAALALHLLKRD
ncbi:MAG: SWIM zinc finger family protein [Thaumarchaeota archaeon]|nr:SWIM zinc finger family protein [Nitrososphaerota archaeon]